MKKLKNHFINQWIFYLSFLALILTSLFLKRIPSYTDDDFKIIFTLFVFLVLIKGLEESYVLHFFAVKVGKGRFISLKLIFFTAFLSMFITNDVSLLIMIPITLATEIKDVERVIILEAIASNTGSIISPFGNPQNIFIYFRYNIHLLDFMKTIFPLFIILMALLFILSPKENKKTQIKTEISPIKPEGYFIFLLFLIFILAILKFLPLWIGIFPVIYGLVLKRNILKVDYFLIFTFLSFFGFTDNLKHILNIQFQFLNSEKIFLYSAILSQIISNVPSTLFLADFTYDWKSLLWGVSVGGFGDLIGSLATLIAYRLYVRSSIYSFYTLLKFHLYGYLFFIVGILSYFLLNL